MWCNAASLAVGEPPGGSWESCSGQLGPGRGGDN